MMYALSNKGLWVAFINLNLLYKVDQLGRVVIPMEIRRVFDFAEGQPLEIFVDDQHIIIRKFSNCCLMCSEASELVEHEGKRMCPDCITKMYIAAQKTV